MTHYMFLVKYVCFQNVRWLKTRKIFLFNHRVELFSGVAIFLYLYTCPGQSFGSLEFDITQAHSLFLLESFPCHLNIYILELIFP